jgi:hypothetical protein
MFAARRTPAIWKPIARGIDTAIQDVQTHGFCAAAWQTEVVALAVPLQVSGQPVHVLNMSVTGPASISTVSAQLSGPLLILAGKIVAGMGT